MRGWGLLLFLVLLVVVVEVNGRRGGGGRGGGGRGGGGSRTSYSRPRSTYTGGKKKSSIKSKLKKAAVIGAVAYGAYQVCMGGRKKKLHKF
jgi:hypothetical protein